MAQDEGSVAGLPEYAEPPFVHIRINEDRSLDIDYGNLALWELGGVADEFSRQVQKWRDEEAEAEEEAE